MPEDFQIFIKPVGAACNLRCSYCYYLEKAYLPEDQRPGTMDDETLEACVKQHFEASSDDTVMFSWHGGEPLLAGISFFRKATEFQKQYKPEGKNVINGIQTNGTLLNDEWCRFFQEENFLVGISIDGPEVIHNHCRRSAGGHGSFQMAMRGYDLLVRHGITTEILCVVSSFNSSDPLRIFDFFRSAGVRYLTFLPLVVRDPSSYTGVTEDSVKPAEFGKFLSAIFDEWIENDIGTVTVQMFEEALRPAFGRDHTLCIFRQDCGKVPVLEHNGDFYSCDHFVDPEHLIGNIYDKSLSGLLSDPGQVAFGRVKSQSLPRYCRECEVLDMCNGECPKNRFIRTPDGEPGLNYLCEGYKLFFNHCRPFIEVLRQTWMNQQERGEW
ncbi:MAG TPA: anaerobic sulfatase maturase [Bacteroidales bacterium]|nr:anaerobic sulfatase maturase [Bacteroidales bacterium]